MRSGFGLRGDLITHAIKEDILSDNALIVVIRVLFLAVLIAGDWHPYGTFSETLTEDSRLDAGGAVTGQLESAFIARLGMKSARLWFNCDQLRIKIFSPGA